MLIDEQFRKCVTYLYIDGADPKSGAAIKQPVATAFFADVVDGPAKVVYAVTAQHVLDKTENHGPLYIRLNTAGAYLDVAAPQEDWTRHLSTDVAAIRVRAPANSYDVLSIPLGSFLTDDKVREARIGVGDEVFFAGLFTMHPGREKVQPIIRFGHVSMMPHEPVNVDLRNASRIDAYLVEARSWGGHSGSPVFVYFPADRQGNSITVSVQVPIFVLGLVHGHHDIVQDVNMLGDIGGTVPLNAGMAVVVPSQKIIDVLMDEELIRDRKKQS
jgi:hypothetical protein